MKLGLALPQYDYSVMGERPLRFATIVEYARLAERSGADSVWLSDHLLLDLSKYGGPDRREACYDPIVTLAALARSVPRVRLGTMVVLEALRPAAVLAKALATVDCLSGGRLDVGLGAGWYEPEYEALGMEMPRPGVRLDRLVDALEVVTGLIGGGPLTYDGRHHCAFDAVNRPPAVQQPRPRVFAGGKGDRLLRIAAQHADGWNTCWTWTPDAYRERLGVFDEACTKAGRDPASMWRTLGLYALCGEDQRDLERRFERLRERSPAGVLDGVDLDTYRDGRLVGTVEEVRTQLQEWEALGVDTLILGVGAVPFQVSAPDDVELLLTACGAGASELGGRGYQLRGDDLSGRSFATTAQDAAALTLRRAAPDAVLDAVQQCVLEAFGAHRARLADVLSRFDAETVGGKELGRARASTTSVQHPGVFLGSLVHDHLPFTDAYG